MKVKIGPYIHFFGPYQIAEKLLFWMDKDSDRVMALGEFLGGKGDHDTWLTKACEWIHSKRKRTIKIKIDRWDTWSMDHTLSMIVVPMLKHLQGRKHGAPSVDDEDVPPELRSNQIESERDGDVDPLWFKRWDWVLGEMIWAHEQIITDDEPDFWITQPEIDWADRPEVQVGDMTCHEIKWKVEGELDWEAHKAHYNRIDNGLRLFGKYYRALWT